eukprot:TRINITY_DN16452_c0_g1_i2.p1 TRINITY_DN16452_c0_g1~~TRINITY_DN16452_c0_g1_i2.p1  ORF type:complete len:439 (-),score=56.81 TRINITY_DN16452_c0_g1_i2:277-1593(-)
MGAQNLLYCSAMEKRWVLPFVISCIILLFLLVITTFVVYTSSPASAYYESSSVFAESDLGITDQSDSVFAESKVVGTSVFGSDSSSESSLSTPRLAYLISGSKGDGERLKRTLLALYHPLNVYIVHLDRDSSLKERGSLYRFLKDNKVFAEIRNVQLVKKSNLVTYRGPTMVTNTLHAAAILLRSYEHWDWFINLSASDYPLVTQDDLLHSLSSVPRDLNFIGHTSNLGWKINKRIRPMIIDPGLYNLRKSEVFWVSERRSVPTAFKMFTGSAWMALSRRFVEYMIWGWDNLPRTLLLYHANVISTPEFYFQTLICNSPQFRNTTVNSDLHYISWDIPPKQHPRSLGLKDFKRMVLSNAPFSRKFKRDDPVLDKIDRDLLGRNKTGFTAGGWCAGEENAPCSLVGNATSLRPTNGSKRLNRLLSRLLSSRAFRVRQCK